MHHTWQNLPSCLEIDEVFEGDINISLQDGPQFSHFIGRKDGDGFATNAIQRIQREVL